MNAVDTNVLFYYLDRSEATKALQSGRLLLSEQDLAVPLQVLCELANGLKKI